MSKASDRALFAPPTEAADLRVAGRSFASWTSFAISASIEQASRSFAFRAASRWPDEQNPIRIRPGAVCEVELGGTKVITGYVDAVEFGFSADDHTVSVSGASKTVDLVDCSAIHTPGRWRNKKIERIASDLAARYGVTVVAEIDTGDPIRRHVLQKGESVFETVERAARSRGLLLVDNEYGELLITRAGQYVADVKGVATFSPTGTTDATTALVVGENILRGATSFDVSERFSEYLCKGMRVGDDDTNGDSLFTTDTADDEGVERVRTLVIEAETRSDKKRARIRAAWEAANRYGQSIRLEYVGAGWRQGDGRLWGPNQRIEVVDPYSGLDGEFLCTEVSYELSDAGSFTTLVLAPEEGYEPIAPFVPRKRKRKPKKRGPLGEALGGGVELPTTPDKGK